MQSNSKNVWCKKDEWKDRCIRTAAEFENFRKRTEKEKLQWISNAQSSVLADVLNIVDDFDRAFAQPADQSRAGFELIYKSLQKMLEKYGVEEIKEVTHFDPTLHEAIMQVESADHQTGRYCAGIAKRLHVQGPGFATGKSKRCKMMVRDALRAPRHEMDYLKIFFILNFLNCFMQAMELPEGQLSPIYYPHLGKLGRLPSDLLLKVFLDRSK